MTISIHADATPSMGSGHVMRCLALALAARQAGMEARFAARVEVPWVRERLEKEDIDFRLLSGPVPQREHPGDLLARIQNDGAGWVVLDGYHFGPDCQRAVMEAGYKLLLIDDCSHLPEYHCDLLLNQNMGAEGLAYQGRIGQTLLGPRYALLRPEFARARARAEQREFPDRARNVLLTLGGGDCIGHLRRIAPDLALPALQGCVLRVVAGGMEQDDIVSALKGCPAKITVLTNVDGMPEIMLHTDLCVTAGGSTCWELCCLGVPFLTVEVAENQRRICDRLDAANIAPRFSGQLFRAVIDSPGLRKKASAAASELVDGFGAQKAVRRLTAAPFYLRPLLPGDVENVWSLAGAPEVRAVSRSTEPISWKDHLQWFAVRLDDPFPLFLVAADRNDVFSGYVRFSLQDECATVSIVLAAEKRGRGLGQKLLADACRLFGKNYPNHTLIALVHPDNIASKHAFLACGFCESGRVTARGIEFLQLRAKAE